MNMPQTGAYAAAHDSHPPIDPLLEPFLHTRDEAEAAEHLEGLIARAAPRIASIARFSRAPEDAFQETAQLLVRQLRELRARCGANAIGNYLHYAKVVAVRVVKGQARQERPRRRSMVDSLRHTLKREPSLAHWHSDGQRLCGLATWRDQPLPHMHRHRLAELLGEPRRFVDLASLECDPEKLSHADLLLRLFHWLGHPIRFEEMTRIVCGLKRIEDLPPASGAAVAGRELSEWAPDTRRRPDEVAEWRQFLERLWAEIELLPPLHRLAYLLNFTAADGDLALFWVYGIASIRSIGRLLGISDEQFERAWATLPLDDENFRHARACRDYDERFALLWQYLPLTDALIAGLLGTERQKVINLRKSAAERLSRRLAPRRPARSIRANVRSATAS